MTDTLQRLAETHGIDTHYWDWHGERRAVSDDTLRAVLAAMDVDPDGPPPADDRTLPPTVTVPAGEAWPLPTESSAVIELEDGTSRDVPVVDGRPTLPEDLPVGYHEVVLDDGERAHVIVAPRTLALPAGLDDRPAWGLATQLYSARSRASWGVGDLADLRTLGRWAADEYGADFVLVNPVHAGEVVPPLNPSPYLPTSRRFANPIYLRVEDLPEFTSLTAEAQREVASRGDAVRGSLGERIERDGPWVAKLAALETLRELATTTPERARGFAGYRADHGVALERFATWCVLCESHGNDWRSWPATLRDPAGPGVAQFAAEHASRVEFFAWVQWLLEDQLRAVQRDVRAAGMRIGVVHDVAVGVSPSGADAWANQDAMATTVTVGAPPDAYSQLGQDWQQPPWRPDRLAESGYQPYRDMFGAALAHCGGLRVDHVIGLFRLWWIPDGREALDGTYVHYDHDALLGVLAIEAQRAGAVVVGEDLGNVEPSAHHTLDERGVLGTSILWFESDHDTGAPLPAERWRRSCLASVTTHDLPPTAGYLAGEHIRLRDSLHLLTRSLEDELAADRDDQQAWLTQLRRDGLLAADTDDPDEIVLALHRFLLRTPSRLRLVALTDAVGERRTQNQPGTLDEYPNWRVPLAGPDGVPLPLDDVLTDPRARRLLELFAGS
nr:4-alpha-glucanotransferase [Jatrophihabitans endophyticus]